MIAHKKNLTDMPTPGSWFTRSVPMKVRQFFFGKLSCSYKPSSDEPCFGDYEDMIVGYEAGWPINCKKLH